MVQPQAFTPWRPSSLTLNTGETSCRTTRLIRMRPGKGRSFYLFEWLGGNSQVAHLCHGEALT